MITIDTAEALRLLDEAVALRGPDFNYRRTYGDQCANVMPEDRRAPEGEEGWAPACIVGVALSLAGASIKELRQGIGIGSTAHHLEMSGRMLLTDEAVMVMGAAQDSQDHGDDWGFALGRARARAAALLVEA